MTRIAMIAAILALASAAGCGGADCTEAFNAGNQCLSGSGSLTPAFCESGRSQACFDCVLNASRPNCSPSAVMACVSSGGACTK
jgi:hypothetical protein